MDEDRRRTTVTEPGLTEPGLTGSGPLEHRPLEGEPLRWQDETPADVPTIREATPFGAPPSTPPATGPAVPATPPTSDDLPTAVQPVVHGTGRPDVADRHIADLRGIDVLEEHDTRRTSRISPASIIAGLAAALLMVTGAVTLARAGTESPLDEPVVTVAGYRGTAVVGIVLLVAGFVLLLGAVARSRPAIVVVGVLLVVAGATVAIEPSVGGDAIATERDAGIALMILAGIVTLIALLVPDVVRTKERMVRH